MFQIYVEGIFKTNIGRKAGAISWNFVLSIFPFLLFLVSVLPYLPHYDELQSYIFEDLIKNIIPGEMKGEIINYITENIMPNTSNTSPLTILLALVFATNGTFALIDGFNDNIEEQHSDVKEYIISFFITIGAISVVVISLWGVYYSEVVLKLFTPSYDVPWLTNNLSKLIGFVSFPLFYFLLLTLFYWVGSAKLKRFTQAIPGAILTTILFVLTTFGFAIYATNFANYNVLYGSIGTMILVMIWVNINVYLLLFGNELNLAIQKVREEKKTKQNAQS
ncbi:MAG: YihY/virulence factor BrkB family protein [Bergeyella zoohelcum]|nr:YihY/virulence factor BrkB family protein [Bergeyella zoohelcum]